MNNNNLNMSNGPTNFRNVRSKSISRFQFDNKTDTLNVRRTLSAPTLSVPPTPPPQPPSQQTSIVSTPTNFGNVRSKSISQFQFDNKTDTLNVRRTLSAPTLSVPPTPPPQPTSIVSIPTTVINQISGIIQPNNVDIFEKMLTKFL